MQKRLPKNAALVVVINAKKNNYPERLT